MIQPVTDLNVRIWSRSKLAVIVGYVLIENEGHNQGMYHSEKSAMGKGKAMSTIDYRVIKVGGFPDGEVASK